MRFQLVRFNRLHYLTHFYYTQHFVCQTRCFSTLLNATPEKWREFQSRLKSLINTLPPYPFRAPPTYSPRVDTLLDQIIPLLQHMTFHRDERQLLISADSITNRRLLKLACFQLHRHRKALDLRNLYKSMDREKLVGNQNKAKPFTTYSRESIHKLGSRLFIVKHPRTSVTIHS